MDDSKPRQQLKMLWPAQRLNSPPAVHLATGYTLRTYQPGDEAGFFKVMDQAGFTNWDEEKLRPWFLKMLPDGWFFVLHQASGEIVATAMANHNPQPLHPFGGELGWVAAHRDHAGKGLGMTVCAAVVRRLLRAGYRNIYLNTDDWRLPAIKTYLRLGWVPFLYAPDMKERWQAICPQLNWAFTPQEWPEAADDTRL
jgi:mycothiol synthase